MSLARKISKYNRERKWNIFLEKMAPVDSSQVIDIGFSENEYTDTDNYIEKHYPYPNNLTALGVDKPVMFKNRYPDVKAIQYDGLRFPFGDKAFDIAWSNAVIEHVGPFEDQLNFLKEIRRISRRGFVTTPNRYFPIEVHTRIPFLHFLPKPLFDKFLRMIGKSWAAGNYMHLLTYQNLQSLMLRAGFVELDFKIIRNKIAGLTLDFVIIW